MLDWRHLSLEDQPLFNEALQSSGIRLSDYAFTNLWIWQTLRHYRWISLEKQICIQFDDDGERSFLYPLGRGDPTPLIQKLIEENQPFRMRAIPESALPSLEALGLTPQPEPERFDYVYHFDDLLHLKGPAYQAKRNFIHQFKNHYHYTYESIREPLIPKVVACQLEWFSRQTNPSRFLKGEHEGCLRALQSFSSLNLIGGALVIDDKVVAYSLAEYMPADTLLIHVEKALTEYKGAYQMILQQLLQHTPPVAFINQEEDLGLPNLMKMKRSHHPAALTKKFLVTKGHF